MEFLINFIAVLFGLSGGIIALTITTIILYSFVVGIQSAMEEQKKKKSKKNKTKGKK